MKIQTCSFVISWLLIMSCWQSKSGSPKEFFDQKNHDQTIPVGGLSTDLKDSVGTNNDLNKQNEKGQKSKKEDDKLKQEREELLAMTKRIIEKNQQIPTFSVYMDNGRFVELKSHYLQVECINSEFENLNTFGLDFYKNYPNSNSQTGKDDGQSFCLRTFKKTNSELSKIIYQRSEGGHTSDKIQLITSDDASKHIFVLPLSYHTGWDGHDTVVESEMNDTTITRKITERYGSSSMHPDSLKKQPRRVVNQQLVVHRNGRMEMVKEEVKKYNIDELPE